MNIVISVQTMHTPRMKGVSHYVIIGQRYLTFLSFEIEGFIVYTRVNIDKFNLI